MENEKSLKGTMAGLAAIVATLAFSSTAKALDAPGVPANVPEVEKPAKEEKPEEKEKEKKELPKLQEFKVKADDKNENGMKMVTGIAFIDDGIDYNEREKAGKLSKLDAERKDIVLSDFRLKGDKVNCLISTKEKSARADLPSLDYFLELATAVRDAHKELLVPKEEPKAEPAKVAEKVEPEKAVKPIYISAKGKNGLEYVTEVIPGKGEEGKTLLVKFPITVGNEIDLKEDLCYCLDLLPQTTGVKHAKIKVIQEEGKDDQYKLVIEYENKTPVEKPIELKDIQRAYAHIKRKEKFITDNLTTTMVKDIRTGEYVFQKDKDKAMMSALRRDDPKTPGYTHALDEWVLEILGDDKVRSSDRRYAKRILSELMRNFEPRKGWYFEIQGTDGQKLHVQGPRSYAKLAEYVKKKNPELKDDKEVLKEINALKYEISFIPGGRPEFQIVVKDEVKEGEETVEKIVATFRHSIEDSRYFGGNAEQVMERAARSAGYSD